MASLPTPFGEIVGYLNLVTGAQQETPFPDVPIIGPIAVTDTRFGFTYDGTYDPDNPNAAQVPVFRWSGPRSGDDVAISGTMTALPGTLLYVYAWTPAGAVWGWWVTVAYLGQRVADFTPNTDTPPLPTLPVDTWLLYPLSTLSPANMAAIAIDDFAITGGDAPPPLPRDIDIHAGPLRAGWGTEPLHANPTSAGRLTCSPLRAGAPRSRYSAGPTYLED